VTTTMPLGPGQVVLDDHGRPVAFRHGRLPGLGFLLAEGTDTWHTADRDWGAGFVVSDRGAAQWAVPDDAAVTDAAATQRFQLLDGLALDVHRKAGDRLRETYRWANSGDTPLRITSLALSTPWRDMYAADGVAQKTAVHAHVNATGAQAWTLAKPMHGQGPLLGLVVREGAVRAYSVEARNQFTSSNVRGHLLLHVTDRARHRHAFGGQPTLTLAPGASYRLVWELAWFEDEAAFLAVAEPTVAVPELAAVVGTPLRIEHPPAMVAVPARAGRRSPGPTPGGPAGPWPWSAPRTARRSWAGPTGWSSSTSARTTATPSGSGCCSTGRWPSWCAGGWPSCSTITGRSSGPGPGGSWPATPAPA
jgi:hypothetical protein